MASRESSLQPSLLWAAPKGSYWDWIRSHLDLQSMVEIDSQQLLNGTATRQETLASATCWVLGVEGRYDADLQSWLSEVLASPSASHDLPAPKVQSKTSRSTKNPSAKTSADSSLEILTRGDFARSGAIILGEPWTGHRRTFPLPDPIVPFYWYELYDRLLPWVSQQTSPSIQPDVAPSKERSKASKNLSKTAIARDSGISSSQAARGYSPRVSNWIDVSQQCRQSPPRSLLRTDGRNTPPFVLVIAESAATTQLWDDLLGTWGTPCLIARPHQLKVQVTPDLVFVDLDTSPREVDYRDGSLPPQPTVDLFNQLRMRFPDALLAGFDAFPRWSCWEKLDRLGVDALFPKPFSTFGLQWCIRRWIDQSPAGTIVRDR